MHWNLEAVIIDCARFSFLKALVLAGLRNPIMYIGPGNTQQTDMAFIFANTDS